MPTVNATSTFGQSRWKAHCEVTDEQFQILANLGMLNVYQRTPSSNAEKEIAGFEKRPDGFKRSSMDFDERFQKVLTKNLQSPIAIDDDGKIQITAVVDSVTKHDIGAGAEPKFAAEKEIVARHMREDDEETLAVWASDKMGYTGKDPLNVENVELLKAVKAFIQRLRAGA